MAITLNGTTGIARPLGSAGSPSDVNTSDSTTGLYFPASNTVGISTGGTNALYIDASQNVGIGTTSPSYKLVSAVTRGSTAVALYNTSAGTYDGWLASTSDNGLAINARGQTAGNATGNTLYLQTGDTTRAVIDSSGRLMIGTTSPQGSSTGYNHLQILYTDTNTNRILGLQNSGSTNTNTFVAFYNSSGGQAGSIAQTGSTSINYGSGSDYRLKENVQKLLDATDRICKLNPVKFNWIEDKTESEGFLAHELQEVVPYAVFGNKDAVNANGNPEYQMVDYSKITPLLVAAIQELSAKVTALEAKLGA
jgi:Chaperone of endosialidase